MTRRIAWSHKARADFLDLLGFIASQDRHAAELVAERIETAVLNLAQRPIGRPGRVQGTYEKSIAKTSHVIVYSLSDAQVTILRIIHTARDWPPGRWPGDIS